MLIIAPIKLQPNCYFFFIKSANLICLVNASSYYYCYCCFSCCCCISLSSSHVTSKTIIVSYECKHPNAGTLVLMSTWLNANVDERPCMLLLFIDALNNVIFTTSLPFFCVLLLFSTFIFQFIKGFTCEAKQQDAWLTPFPNKWCIVEMNVQLVQVKVSQTHCRSIRIEKKNAWKFLQLRYDT